MVATLSVVSLHLSPDTSPPTIAMARPKGEKGSIQMFQPYKADLVPAVMPFPDLANVVTAKNDETAVPKLNDFQRSWIHDVALRGADLANLTKQDATDLYDSIKRDAFNAAPFKHTPQPGDEAEESRLPGLVAAWKLARKKADASGSAGHAGGAEEDEEGRTGLLRGYTLNGWKIAIQKVLSNKRTAEKNKVAKDAKTQPTAAAPAPAPASAVAKLMGMMQYGGRDKFRDDRHDEIHKYSKTLPGEGNPGGKFRKAEALLWEKEDQAAWAAAAMVEEDVDWELRQKLVASGVKHLVDTVHSSGKFRPFVATMTFCWLDAEGKAQFEWAEAIPSGIVVAQPFTEQFPDQAAEMINKMYIWAEKPLKDFVATREKSAQAPPPVFPLSLAALDDTGHKTLAQAVCDYLVRSYDAAFGTQDIPWGSIATAPGDFYETAGFEAKFAETGLTELTRDEWHNLARALAAAAGPGTRGFFRKPPPRTPPPRTASPHTPPPRTPPPCTPSPHTPRARTPPPCTPPPCTPPPRTPPPCTPPPCTPPPRTPPARTVPARTPPPRTPSPHQTPPPHTPPPSPARAPPSPPPRRGKRKVAKQTAAPGPVVPRATRAAAAAASAPARSTRSTAKRQAEDQLSGCGKRPRK
ncbi:hypothetical protein C8R47DRAFT_1078440 [Mycena vitilis]|nr:hypothetical protein C8R47DRAFT_1078440 [Mycena vitilis]